MDAIGADRGKDRQAVYRHNGNSELIVRLTGMAIFPRLHGRSARISVARLMLHAPVPDAFANHGEAGKNIARLGVAVDLARP